MAGGKPSGSSGAWGIGPGAKRQGDPHAPGGGGQDGRDNQGVKVGVAYPGHVTVVARQWAALHVPPEYQGDVWDDPDDFYQVADVAWPEVRTWVETSRRRAFRQWPTRGEFDDESCRRAYGLVCRHIPARVTRYFDERGLHHPAHVAIHANVTRVKVRISVDNHAGGGLRGRVRGMSRESRRRLMDKIAGIRGMEDSWFLTLTYPDVFPEDWQRWKRDLKAFILRLKRMAESFGIEIGGVWRLEQVLRKSGVNIGRLAPHFHLLVVGLEGCIDLDEFRVWISRAWYEVCATGDPKHLEAGTSVSPVEDWAHVMRYTSKYIAKADVVVKEGLTECPGECTGCEVPEWCRAIFGPRHEDENEFTGRVWGTFGVPDETASLEFDLPVSAIPTFRRVVAGWLRSRGQARYGRRVKRGVTSFSVLGLGDSSQGLSSAGPGGEMTTIDRMIDFAFDAAIELEASIKGGLDREFRPRNKRDRNIRLSGVC